MTPLPGVVFLAALAASLAWMPPAGAQTPRPGSQASVAQAERNSVDLKQGMTLEEVQKLDPNTVPYNDPRVNSAVDNFRGAVLEIYGPSSSYIGPSAQRQACFVLYYSICAGDRQEP